MSLVLNGSGIVSSNIVDGTLVDADISTATVVSLKSGRKNLIINGDMQVSQRGTSGTKSGNGYGGYLSVDRWSVYYDDTVSSHQSDVLVDGSLVDTFKVTAAGAYGRMYAYSNIEEGAKLISGKPFSVSFWIRGNTALSIQNQVRMFAANSAYSSNQTTVLGTVSVTTSWQKITYNNVTVTDTSLNGSRWTGLWFYDSTSQAGSGNHFEIAQVQLELGSVATDFEHRSFGEELALCQRYFEKSFPYATAPANGSNATSFSTNAGKFITAHSNNSDKRDDYKFRVEKRISPTMGIYGNSNGYWYSYSTGWHQNNRYLAADATGFQSTQQATGNIVDVQGHWTADAEL